MDFFLKSVDGINEWIGKAVSWLFLALIFSVVYDLTIRYFTGKTTDWAFDVNYMIYGVQFMLAGAYTLKYNAHVRVDVLYMMFSPKGRAILDIIFYVLIMIPVCAFVFWSTWGDFVQAVQQREVGIYSAWHPPVYHFKGVMPATFALLVLQSLVQLIRSGRVLIKGSDK
jgi:TRAP-type mannitol/chloroaromatic compound transport system permease small subunit